MRGILTGLKQTKDPLFKGAEFHSAETSKTLKDLKEEKYRLVQEVRKLGNVFFDLKESSEKIKKDLGDVTTERLSVLENIGKEINKELQEKTLDLKTKSEKLDVQEHFLTDLLEYLTSFYAYNSELATKLKDKSLRIEKDEQSIIEKDNKIENAWSEVVKIKEKTKKVLLDKENSLKELNNITKYFQKEADKERRFLKKWRKRLLNKGFDLKAKEDSLKINNERLIQRQRRIREKEMSLMV